MADEVKLIKNIHAAIEEALFWGDRLTNSEFSVLMQPGQFISTSLKEDDGSDDMNIQYMMTNQILDTSFLYKELTGSILETYQSILRRRALPHRELTPNEVIEIEETRRWLSDHYDEYNLYQDRYFDADEAYENERHSQNPSSSRLRRLKTKRDQANSNWETFGYKSEYDRKYADLRDLVAFSPRQLWVERTNRLDDQHRVSPNRGEFWQVFLNPPISTWNSATTSWATYEKQISERDSYNYSKATSWSGGLSGRWGLWSWGAGGSGSSLKQKETSEVNAVNVKFDYLRVRINRPWLDSNIFHERFWTWDKQWGLARLSDGGRLGQNPPLRPIGLMPFLPTHFIVARNVELQANFSQSDRDFYESKKQSNASVGWGPFSVRGSYSEHEREESIQASFDGTTFHIAQPQIIGWTGILLPRCPDPIRRLPWDDRADLDLENDENLTASLRHIDYQDRKRIEKLQEKMLKLGYQEGILKSEYFKDINIQFEENVKDSLEYVRNTEEQFEELLKNLKNKE